MRTRHLEETTFQALEMPYEDRDLSMVVFLPTKADGLAAFEKSLTPEKLNTWLGRLSRWPRGIVVQLPRFTARSRLELKRTLQSMGIRMAFATRNKMTGADFSGIFDLKKPDRPETQPWLGPVLQEACIDVTEKGTRASAATIAGFVKSTDRADQPILFRADHPFMFIIYHKPSGCILFMGRVTDPSKLN